MALNYCYYQRTPSMLGNCLQSPYYSWIPSKLCSNYSWNSRISSMPVNGLKLILLVNSIQHARKEIKIIFLLKNIQYVRNWFKVSTATETVKVIVILVPSKHVTGVLTCLRQWWVTEIHSGSRVKPSPD